MLPLVFSVLFEYLYTQQWWALYSADTCQPEEKIPEVFFFNGHILIYSSTGKRFLPSVNFRISRDHRCLPFSPPACAFTFFAHRVQYSHFSACDARQSASKFANSCSPLSACELVTRAPCGTRTYDIDLNSYAAYH